MLAKMFHILLSDFIKCETKLSSHYINYYVQQPLFLSKVLAMLQVEDTTGLHLVTKTFFFFNIEFHP